MAGSRDQLLSALDFFNRSVQELETILSSLLAQACVEEDWFNTWAGLKAFPDAGETGGAS